jgi:HD-GYP domain-containing protein (c-di-GMP phosphodiesterase class II)
MYNKNTVELLEELIEPSTEQNKVECPELYDVYGIAHGKRVAATAVPTARILGLPEEKIKYAEIAYRFHDFFKRKLKEEFWFLPREELAKKQRYLIDHHASYSSILFAAAVLAADKNNPGLNMFKELNDNLVFKIINEHHRYYQEYDDLKSSSRIIDKKKLEYLALAAQILTVADSVDAMLSNRPYRSYDFSYDEVMVELKEKSGIGLDEAEQATKLKLDDKRMQKIREIRKIEFNPEVVRAFAKISFDNIIQIYPKKEFPNL